MDGREEMDRFPLEPEHSGVTGTAEGAAHQGRKALLELYKAKHKEGRWSPESWGELEVETGKAVLCVGQEVTACLGSTVAC